MNSRPTFKSPNIIEKVVDRLFLDVLEWLDSFETKTEEKEYPEIKQQLKQLLQYSFDYDGYKLARDLEREYWEVDARLVEILDNVIHLLFDAKREEVKLWIKENNLTPKYNLHKKIKYQYLTGIITKINAEELTYHVKLEDKTLILPEEDICLAQN